MRILRVSSPYYVKLHRTCLDLGAKVKNVTHNLRDFSKDVDAKVTPWAKSFDTFVKEAIEKRDFEALIDFQKQNRYASHAHPTLEHYIPLLYVAGVSSDEDSSQFIYDRIEHGTFSMRNWLVG